MQALKTTTPSPAHRTVLRSLSLLVLGTLALTGCGGTVSIPVDNPVTPPITQPLVNGDWVFITTPTTGAAPFLQLVGSLAQSAAGTNGSSPVQALLQVRGAGPCYIGTILVPAQGSLKAGALSLYSFGDNQQYVTFAATSDSTNTHLTGTYSVGGGCANGVAGTIAGTRYLPLSGTYTGPTSGGSSTVTVGLLPTQASQSNGDGSFNLSGTSTFSGSSCFTSGTVSSGYVLGNAVHIVLATNEAGGSQVQVDGTLNETATTITAATISVKGGGCSGSLGSATLFVGK